ncbi:hypothetical protein EYF80_066627 [Liparis tanakae]|uniref:Uncharacterized protein n=1 Tax=Liparis tanakae TaxID=230148 RepID=A0A4Z2E3N0_9TELE|nr:hypothetical protein EYF80_066627 [Liparis tanakae]
MSELSPAASRSSALSVSSSFPSSASFSRTATSKPAALNSERVRGQQGERDLPVGAQVGVRGHEGDHVTRLRLRELALEDPERLGDGGQLRRVVVEVQHGDVDPGRGGQTAGGPVHRRHLGATAGSPDDYFLI